MRIWNFDFFFLNDEEEKLGWVERDCLRMIMILHNEKVTMTLECGFFVVETEFFFRLRIITANMRSLN